MGQMTVPTSTQVHRLESHAMRGEPWRCGAGIEDEDVTTLLFRWLATAEDLSRTH